MWTSYVAQPYKYYASAFQLVPRRNQSDFDKFAERNGESNHDKGLKDSNQETKIVERAEKLITVHGEQNHPSNSLPSVEI